MAILDVHKNHIENSSGAEMEGGGDREQPEEEEIVGKKETAVVVAKSEEEWARLIHTQGLLVVDVYSSWCGHCAAMESHLKKLKIANITASDHVTLARACCDRIEELAPFRSDARPTWLFLSSGVPTALLRGMNRPLLTKLFQNEILLEREPRLPVMINYRSPAVIQCAGPLANLATDQVVHSIGSGRTEMLSKLFQDVGVRIMNEARERHGGPHGGSQTTGKQSLSNVVKQTMQLQEYKEVKNQNGKSESEIEKEQNDELQNSNSVTSFNEVDSMMYDCGEYSELGEGEDGEVFNEDISTKETICPEEGEEKKNTEVRKPRRNREMKAGLLKEILLNRGNKRTTFSGLYM